MAKRAIGFIPELKFKEVSNRKIKLTSGISILPESDILVSEFKSELATKGYKVSGGGYLYFEGDLKQDGTLYEVFQGYALALTFFSPKGRASCRALRDLDAEEGIHFFIDEYDKFGYEEEDIISVQRKDISHIRSIFTRVEAQLENKDFNPLRNSLEFFILFLSEKPIRTRLLYLSICLESILLEGENEGLAYKLGIRCANLLNAFYTNVVMSSIFDELKNSYVLRSKIIHGDDYKKESDRIIRRGGSRTTELDHVLNLESIVKDILSLIFSNQELYDLSIASKLGKIIDERYILDS